MKPRADFFNISTPALLIFVVSRFGQRGNQPTDRLLDKIISSSTPGRTALVAARKANECFFFDFKEDGTYSIFKQKAVHRNDADDEVVFEMDEKSDGSIRLLDFIPMLIDLGQNEVDYMIDELDRSMHPLLSQNSSSATCMNFPQ